MTSLKQIFDFLIVALMFVSLWQKKNHHWRYFQSANRISDDLDLGSQTLKEMSEQNSISPAIETLFKFVLPFFKPELLDTGEKDLKILKRKVVISITAFWITFLYTVVIAATQYEEYKSLLP